ncbi:uncharacterized protein LOC124419669 [Lucilia cuprina]|uniref:uncharacterized protein LOC124419669 n=1 Tax=Lucilia cuprina TaxID=7375 RepID=UPI001F054947|nr:uncharacterized protein LOC124419669 [Lucilia cuprina]
MDTKMLKNDQNCGAKSGPNLIFLGMKHTNILGNYGRNTYRRETNKDKLQERSGSSQTKPSNWIFKKHLDFLSDAFKSRSVNSSLEWDNKEFNFEYLEDCVPEIFDLTQNSSDASSTTKSIEMPKLILKSPPKKKLTQEKNFEEIINTNTQQLIQALNESEDKNPFDGVIEFIKETLKQQSESTRILLKKELMEVTLKYRYNT